MNVHILYRAHHTSGLESEINLQVEKLGRRMKAFSPELVHLHGDVIPGPAKKNGSTTVNLNLRIPSGQLAASSTANQPAPAVKAAFHDLLKQLDAHKDHLRNKRNFHRKSPQRQAVPFESTLASIKPQTGPASPAATNGDIRLFVNTNFRDLERFIRRQYRLRLDAGELSPNLVTPAEVLDETIATALDDQIDYPALMSIEEWLYRVALQAIDAVADRNRGESGEISMEEPRGIQNVSGTDDEYLQFHQPDDTMFVEDLIPDPNLSNPEEIAYSRESIEQVGAALTRLKQPDRVAFVLFALEGFTVPEIARIVNRKDEEVRASLAIARAALDKGLAPDNAYRSLLKDEAQAA